MDLMKMQFRDDSGNLGNYVTDTDEFSSAIESDRYKKTFDVRFLENDEMFITPIFEQDAVSPEAEVVRIEEGVKLIVRDNRGTTEAEIYDGADGEPGPMGPVGPEGPEGQRGETGISISYIEQTEHSLIDRGINTITIHLEDGQEFSFDIRNGSHGDQGEQGPPGDKGSTGVGIKRIELGTDYRLYIYYTNGTMTVTDSVRGRQGPQGPAGESGTGVYRITIDTESRVTFWMTDGRTFTTPPLKGEPGHGNTNTYIQAEEPLEANPGDLWVIE